MQRVPAVQPQEARLHAQGQDGEEEVTTLHATHRSVWDANCPDCPSVSGKWIDDPKTWTTTTIPPYSDPLTVSGPEPLLPLYRVDDQSAASVGCVLLTVTAAVALLAGILIGRAL
jgi:hypothetical protein